ncbi:MAG: coenzyme F420-0:L-glutamate ligase [Candidatus Bathyarchaeia archaeon]
MKTKLEYIPIRTTKKRRSFNLYKGIVQDIEGTDEKIRNNDIIVLASKYVALAQGRFVDLKKVKASKKAIEFSERFDIPKSLSQLILKEAQQILGGASGYVLTVKDGVAVPNAGIDRSNIFPGFAILHPKHPFREARKIKREILRLRQKSVGVIITDSRLMPLRLGTTGVALGVAGIHPVKDERGRRDLFGNKLKVTMRAIADDISAGAQLLIGEANEATPIVIVRAEGNVFSLTETHLEKKDLSVETETCIYTNAFRSYFT